MMSLESLYQELILDHSKRPKGKGIAEATDRSAVSHQRNPICGDEVTLQVRLTDDGTAIRDITWDGAGCSISQASASMLVALVDEERELAGTEVGVEDARALIEKFREALRSRGSIPLDEETFGDAAALSGVSKYTARVKCAMLAWVALEDTLARA
ncbi:SUF system NifU family Fe-S cluster assembly protein [Microbacterium sp. SSW1-59]|uniref:Fe-S cluster assembly sulfur transfer protein SufU n=1 Tax=Microbacterium xanthum TaxID=3079794 RepID=UPI002AD27025|nr:SUF system NifU family Fe-S cluster assembly protein [Microbacterium sp. SSW1-59]MDZ8200607.1 SUF system NifU family Fe-S cluster assembly protein [Microbacterium sp. SSW1-59]